MPTLTSLHLGPGAFHPTFTPALLHAPNLHTLTLDLASHRATTTLATALSSPNPPPFSSLTYLILTDSYLDQSTLVPPSLLAFLAQLTGLRTLRLERYYPAHLADLLRAVSAPLEEVALQVYLRHAVVPGLGRVLREAARGKGMEGVRRWGVVVEAEASGWAAGRGWEDFDWREWRMECEGRGAVIDYEVFE